MTRRLDRTAAWVCFLDAAVLVLVGAVPLLDLVHGCGDARHGCAFAKLGALAARVRARARAFHGDDRVLSDRILERRRSHRSNGCVATERERSARIFVGTAASKEFDDTPRAIAKIGELLRLDGPPSLHWTVHTIADADHGTALLAAAQSGLEFTFAGWRLPSYVFDQGIEAAEAYYADRSTEYGMPVPVPEGELIALVALAESLDHAGDRAARDAYAKAIGLAETAHGPRAAALRRRFNAPGKAP